MSAYYEYENVDIANREQVRTLKEQKSGRIVPALGIEGIPSKARIMQAAPSPKQAGELRCSGNGGPTVFFSLGGRVERPEIKLKNAVKPEFREQEAKLGNICHPSLR